MVQNECDTQFSCFIAGGGQIERIRNQLSSDFAQDQSDTWPCLAAESKSLIQGEMPMASPELPFFSILSGTLFTLA